MVSDFGFSKVLRGLKLTETICGTPVYGSPQVFSHENYSLKADVWAFGVILYELLHNDVPFRAAGLD